MNILLTNIGRRTYIVKYFEELKKKYKLNIYLLDSSKFVPSFKVSRITKNFVSPRASSKEKYSSKLSNCLLTKIFSKASYQALLFSVGIKLIKFLRMILINV